MAHVARASGWARALRLVPFVVGTAAAQPPFEGVVTLRMGGAVAPSGPPGAAMGQEVEYLISGQRVRMNLGGPAGGMAVLVLPAEQKLVVLVTAQRAFMERPLREATAAAGRGDAPPPPDVAVTTTGRRDTVAGVPCEPLLLRAPAPPGGAPLRMEVCVSRELGAFANPMTALGGGREPPWQQALAARGFPLRITGAEGTALLEVTRIERKRLAPSLFAIPESYSRLPVPPRR